MKFQVAKPSFDFQEGSVMDNNAVLAAHSSPEPNPLVYFDILIGGKFYRHKETEAVKEALILPIRPVSFSNPF